jgi:hypothetical protein
MPFYDHPLAEFGTTVPARLKLEGIERTKRLFRVAMEGTLPDIINHRTDKLGHSVPLKNWLRSGGVLGSRVQARLRDAASPLRQFVRPTQSTACMPSIRAAGTITSHRLWAAFVLDDWLRGAARWLTRTIRAHCWSVRVPAFGPARAANSQMPPVSETTQRDDAQRQPDRQPLLEGRTNIEQQHAEAPFPPAKIVRGHRYRGYEVEDRRQLCNRAHTTRRSRSHGRPRRRSRCNARRTRSSRESFRSA